ncbi:MAG: ATP-binding protein [Flavobacterium sp.]
MEHKTVNTNQPQHIEEFLQAIKNKSDNLMNYYIISYFAFGLFLASYYDTWEIAIGVGSLLLIAYFSAKLALPKSDFYQYVLSAVLGIFMAQFIYQMHGMFEMHFTAFVASAILITYQKWKLQIPLIIVVIVHHGLFAYLQYIGLDKIYFTQLDYMSLQTFVFHIILTGIIFTLCGLWAYQFKKYSEKHIALTFKKQEIENQELKIANYELDRFVYCTSHDLRAPLKSIMGLIEIASDETNEKATLEYLNMLKGKAQKLDGFISDILDYSRNTRMEITKEVIDFKAMLDEISHNLKFMGDTDRTVDFGVEIVSDIPVYADKNRLNTALNNLVSNAIRYQDAKAPDPFVKIKIETSEAQTKIIISDNGIGIPKELQPKIFDMFYRVSNQSIGSGLGLYIVKEAVNKLNGSIEVQSEVGKGTSFVVCIPNG